MPNCPICGLGERCRNHWVAVQEPSGEVEFQVGAMTASEDNLVMLRNKLGNPPLRLLFEKLALQPAWAEEQGRANAYLAWPLELRGAVHRTLFPNGAPGADNRPLPDTPIFEHRLHDLKLCRVTLDLENCLPDEILYQVGFQLELGDVGIVHFLYQQIVWAEGVEWTQILASPGLRGQAEALILLLMGGLVDTLRASFSGQTVKLIAEQQPSGIEPGSSVDEIAAAADPARGLPELHFGEEVERLLNERRLQPLLRDTLLQFSRTPVTVH